MHFELHTFAILFAILPYLLILVSKRNKVLFLDKKGALILAIVSILMFLGDLISHSI